LVIFLRGHSTCQCGCGQVMDDPSMRHGDPDARATATVKRPDAVGHSAAGFGNWFRDRCNEAKVPGRAHGLRKASAVRHALYGARAFELIAWHGWQTIQEAQRYVEEANRVRLAESGGAKLFSGTGIGSPIDPVSQNTAQAIEK
jgi:hypothetical protein